jgi:hypothetical protein
MGGVVVGGVSFSAEVPSVSPFPGGPLPGGPTPTPAQQAEAAVIAGATLPPAPPTPAEQAEAAVIAGVTVPPVDPLQGLPPIP